MGLSGPHPMPLLWGLEGPHCSWEALSQPGAQTRRPALDISETRCWHPLEWIPVPSTAPKKSLAPKGHPVSPGFEGPSWAATLMTWGPTLCLSSDCPLVQSPSLLCPLASCLWPGSSLCCPGPRKDENSPASVFHEHVLSVSRLLGGDFRFSNRPRDRLRFHEGT